VQLAGSPQLKLGMSKKAGKVTASKPFEPCSAGLRWADLEKKKIGLS